MRLFLDTRIYRTIRRSNARQQYSIHSSRFELKNLPRVPLNKLYTHTWVQTVARNKSLDTRKKEKRNKKRFPGRHSSAALKWRDVEPASQQEIEFPDRQSPSIKQTSRGRQSARSVHLDPREQTEARVARIPTRRLESSPYIHCVSNGAHTHVKDIVTRRDIDSFRRASNP